MSRLSSAAISADHLGPLEEVCCLATHRSIIVGDAAMRALAHACALPHSGAAALLHAPSVATELAQLLGYPQGKRRRIASACVLQLAAAAAAQCAEARRSSSLRRHAVISERPVCAQDSLDTTPLTVMCPSTSMCPSLVTTPLTVVTSLTSMCPPGGRRDGHAPAPLRRVGSSGPSDDSPTCPCAAGSEDTSVTAATSGVPLGGGGTAGEMGVSAPCAALGAAQGAAQGAGGVECGVELPCGAVVGACSEAQPMATVVELALSRLVDPEGAVSPADQLPPDMALDASPLGLCVAPLVALLHEEDACEETRVHAARSNLRRDPICDETRVHAASALAHLASCDMDGDPTGFANLILQEGALEHLKRLKLGGAPERPPQHDQHGQRHAEHDQREGGGNALAAASAAVLDAIGYHLTPSSRRAVGLPSASASPLGHNLRDASLRRPPAQKLPSPLASSGRRTSQLVASERAYGWERARRST